VIFGSSALADETVEAALNAVGARLEKILGLDSIAVGEAHLPTSTKFNNIHWPDVALRLPDIKCFDNIAHNGRRTERNDRKI
jgi:hypothetical protein